MASDDFLLMAHLMRRAGFGASYEELERRVAVGYEATVEELLHPDDQPVLEMDVMHRYMHGWKDMHGILANQAYWTYRMVNSPRPLEEKMCLLWHCIFPVGNSKCMRPKQIQIELENFRSYGFGKFSRLLFDLATDPAMLFYLDNQLSHKEAVNENWGRELLELFSMGLGMDGSPNYTEEDVQACARAFTGWTIANAIPRHPYGAYDNHFLYNRYDHDDDEKTFLGETGNFNGEEIIDIIAKQPSTARFVSRHLSNFFVTDEPQTAFWQNTPPQHPELIASLEEEYFRSDFEIRPMLRVLFNSEAFKNARFTKVKSPAELVAGTLRLTGTFKRPAPRLYDPVKEIRYMGQDLLNPPTVEGWHTGQEWIDSGTLLERINFATGEMGAINTPGIRAIIDRLGSEGPTMSAERLLDGCLEMLGGYELNAESRALVIDHTQSAGALRTGTEEFAQSVGQTLQYIVSTQEYQFA